MELLGSVKNYEWGKMGDQSAVAQLAKFNSAAFRIERSKPYAELWMGAHPSGPSIVKETGQELGEVVPEGLPYLFKVLSIRKALSIQVHPVKATAELLHKTRPDKYLDDNHKPELAIALTSFVGLCGFRPYVEIEQFCRDFPPLRLLLGNDAIEHLRRGDLRHCYETLMNADQDTVFRCINEIITDFRNLLVKHNLLALFHTINDDYPNDVGVLSIFFMNVITLDPGEAIFLGANEIHAYISGDCVECMACSDNVIRAGLTPKYKDVAQLISCLNYAGLPAESKVFKPRKVDENLQLFVPPVPDFAVAQISLPAAVGEYTFQMEPTGLIMLVLHGERTLRMKELTDISLKRGSIVYIPPEAAPDILFLSTDENSNEGFFAYIAMRNVYQDV